MGPGCPRDLPCIQQSPDLLSLLASALAGDKLHMASASLGGDGLCWRGLGGCPCWRYQWTNVHLQPNRSLPQTLQAVSSKHLLSREISQCPGVCVRNQPLPARLSKDSQGVWVSVLRVLLFYGGQRHVHVTTAQQTSRPSADQAGQHQTWDAFHPWFVTHTIVHADPCSKAEGTGSVRVNLGISQAAAKAL